MKSIEYTVTVVKFTQFFCVSLLTWEDGNNDRKLGYTTSVVQKVIFCILSTYLCCEAVYHMGLMWLFNGKMDSDGAKPYLKMIGHATTRIAGLGFAILLAFKSKDAAYLYNQILVLNRRFQATYCIVIPTWTRILAQKQRKVDWLEWKKNGVRDASYHLYRSPQILSNAYNNCYSVALAWALGASMNVIVMSLTMTIRVVPKTKPLANLQFPGGFIAMLLAVRYAIVPLAGLKSASTEFAASYRHTWGTSKALARRKIRSMRPLEAKCSGFFVMNRETLLEYWSQVLNNTVTVLLMT